jgi:type IV secretion system protein VirB1
MMLALATLAAYLQTCAPSVAPDTMRAIVSVESRGYIYAINDNTSRLTYCVPGAAMYPCNRDQAASLAENAVRSGHSVDVGIAQVNSGNFRTYGVRATQMLDACENLRVGSKILASTYQQSRARFADDRAALWHAIMAYNTGSLFAGEGYVQSVVRAAFGNDGPTVPSVAILRSSGLEPYHLGSVAPHGEETVARPHVRHRMSPRSAPLLAEGLEISGQGGGVLETLRAALSH